VALVALNECGPAPPWHAQHAQRAIDDLLDLCTHCPQALEASARALERAAGELPSGDVAQEVADTGALFLDAQRGSWQAFEHYLQRLGARYARAGLPISAWYGVAGKFSGAITARAVDRHAAEPARLTQVLLALNELVEHSLSTIAIDYYRVKAEREAEVKLRHSRLINAAPDAVIEIDEHDIVSEFNPAAERTFGYPRERAIGQPLAGLIVPERARDRHRAGIARFLATGESHMIGQRVEITAVRADGVELPIELALVATDRFGGGRGFVGFLRDLSEERESKRALAQSASRLEILSNTAHEFAASHGEIGTLLELVARRLGEIIGDGCAVRLISDDGAWLEPSTSFYHRDPETRELARHVLGTERQRLGEGLAGRAAATGEPVLVPVLDPAMILAITPARFRSMLARVGVSSALAIPLRSQARTIGAISLLRNRPGSPYTVDDQHLAQDLADRAGLAVDNALLVGTLEQRVAERTAALEAVNHELEAFSYSVSHDLRTPLRAIDGFSRALLSDYAAVLDDRAQRYLQRIRAGTQRMAELIDDLLDLARITRMSLTLTVNDLSSLAEDVVTEIRKHDPARTTAVHVAPGLSARCDSRMLKIALENLLGNAWKFTAKHDAAQIWFGAEAGAWFVRDTGVGFDMTYADKLFAPFQRLHSARDYDGTGIGLATVHRIVTHHGGRIWAEAETGKGATFYFTLGDGHGRATDHPARRG
jgi:PAS domain S-box-containing protein